MSRILSRKCPGMSRKLARNWPLNWTVAGAESEAQVIRDLKSSKQEGEIKDRLRRRCFFVFFCFAGLSYIFIEISMNIQARPAKQKQVSKQEGIYWESLLKIDHKKFRPGFSLVFPLHLRDFQTLTPKSYISYHASASGSVSASVSVSVCWSGEFFRVVT